MSVSPPLVTPDEGPQVAALALAYASGGRSPVEVCEAALKRAEEINPLLNAFVSIDHEGARAAAKASEARWRAGAPLSPIDGIPTTLKDIVWVRDWSVRYGSATTPDAPYTQDAPSVRGLREAGAVFIGLTTSPEFGWKAVTDSSAFGITRNPHDPARTPGGSSGGAAAAAAAGAGVLHLGTDGGGSIRVPASFSGIAGLKPTFGRVAANPPSAFGTVAHIGPMARHAADLVPMLKAMSGRDKADWAQGEGVLASLDAGVTQDFPKGARIGVWATPPCGTVEAPIAAAFAAALKELEAQGAILEEIALPFADRVTDIFEKHWFSGAAKRRTLVPEAKWAGLDPGFLAIADVGASFSALDLVTAGMERTAFGAAMDQLLARYDFIVSPGVPVLPFRAGDLVPEGSGLKYWHLWAGFSFPLNLSQHPGAIVQLAPTEGGLPRAFQIIGARGADGAVLAAAMVLEEMLKGAGR
ncbi:amidase [Azorhizobium oxalatiphilum]|uniref:Amidase n=1 Tax=Azorhizobium oxalatiphilum TaxID=980631 RepID=A0A917C573_9HYPH|nr:amidase family protein [Azorhizobium oxalatiphilum]GGF70593.1 amidase [Azorhizobium oxalatiphilum]